MDTRPLLPSPTISFSAQYLAVIMFEVDVPLLAVTTTFSSGTFTSHAFPTNPWKHSHTSTPPEPRSK